MRFIFTSYSSTREFKSPELWLERLEGYTGILEALIANHKVIGIERIDYEGNYVKNNVQYIFIRQKQLVTRFPFRLHNLIKNLSPDVVFINGLIFPWQIIQLRLKLGKRVKIILLHRGEKPFYGIKAWLQRMADTCIDAYLFTSAEFGIDWSKGGIISDQNKIHEVIQASSSFQPQNKFDARKAIGVDGQAVFLWVGRFDRNKDPITVIRAFIQYTILEPGAKLFMIYQSDELLKEIKEILNSDTKASFIKLVGKLAHQELHNWYNAADFIISGSHHEGSGIAVCEAMSCGCIPLVTNIISFRRMTGPGKCGMLYEPGNTESLLQALMRTKNMDMEKERSKVLYQFKTELSYEAVANKIEKVIESIKR